PPASSPAGVFTVATIRTRFTSTRITGWGCARTGPASAAVQTIALTITFRPDRSLTVAARKSSRIREIVPLTQHRDIAVPLPFHPHFAIGKVLFLPDRHRLFQTIDPLQRSIECRSSVGRSNDHGAAAFADQHAAQPVHHGYAADRVVLHDFAPDFRHCAERHWFIALVIKEQRTPAVRVVTNRAFERDHGPFGARHQPADYGPRVDRLA